MKPKKRLPGLLTCLSGNSAGSTERAHPEPMAGARGSVLMVTIWIVAILVLFVVSLSALVSSRLNSVKYFRDMNRAYLIAAGAVNKATAELNKEAAFSTYDGLSEAWSNNPEAFSEIKLGGGVATVSYEYPKLDGTTITLYGCADEERRININKVGRAVLETLFSQVAGLTAEKSAQMATDVMFWRAPPKPGDKPEDNSYYQGLSPPYPCKHGEFEVPEELLLVKGMTPEIFGQIKDTITVYGAGRVNINTAISSTLQALGLSRSLIDKIFRFRAGTDEILGTEDDNILTKESDLITRLPGLTPDETAMLNNLSRQDLITVQSRYYRITARGTINNKTKEITCIVRRGGPVISWRER